MGIALIGFVACSIIFGWMWNNEPARLPEAKARQTQSIREPSLVPPQENPRQEPHTSNKGPM
jgi:predicted P-loop ATPase